MVYVLLAPGFEEAEALVPADVLRRAGAEVSLVGLFDRFVSGSHGVTVTADLTVDGVSLSAGDMVMVPGGPGYARVEESEAALRLIRQAAADETTWVAAICAAPTLLARMGLMKGKRAVCYPGMEDILVDGGAVPHMDCSVVRDGRFITGRAPGSAFDFALTLTEILAGADTAARLREDMLYKGYVSVFPPRAGTKALRAGRKRHYAWRMRITLSADSGTLRWALFLFRERNRGKNASKGLPPLR